MPRSKKGRKPFPITGIGGRITRKLGEKGWTGTDLAKAVGTDDKRVSAWRHNKNEPSPDYIIKIAEALGVSPVWIATGEDEDHQKKIAETVDATRAARPDRSGGETDRDLQRLLRAVQAGSVRTALEVSPLARAALRVFLRRVREALEEHAHDIGPPDDDEDCDQIGDAEAFPPPATPRAIRNRDAGEGT